MATVSQLKKCSLKFDAFICAHLRSFAEIFLFSSSKDTHRHLFTPATSQTAAIAL